MHSTSSICEVSKVLIPSLQWSVDESKSQGSGEKRIYDPKWREMWDFDSVAKSTMHNTGSNLVWPRYSTFYWAGMVLLWLYQFMSCGVTIFYVAFKTLSTSLCQLSTIAHNKSTKSWPKPERSPHSNEVLSTSLRFFCSVSQESRTSVLTEIPLVRLYHTT